MAPLVPESYAFERSILPGRTPFSAFPLPRLSPWPADPGADSLASSRAAKTKLFMNYCRAGIKVRT